MSTATLRYALTALGAMIASTALAFSTPAYASATWPTYHATPDRQGADTNEGMLSPSTQAWRATLDGAVYGQPVVANNLIYVATENDTVYALSAHDGSVVWERSLGTPLHGVGAAAGCGDIDPLGVTSTPVIDPVSGTLYVVAEVASGSGQGAVVHHQLIGLNPSTGAVGVSTSADPPIGSVPPSGQSTIWLQQRGALAVANGRVYVTYGGLAGDCGIYHGWVVGVDESAARPNVSFDATPNGQGGAIWGPSGAAVDAAGNVYVTTGNPNNPQNPPVDDSESAVKLDAGLNRLAAYRDTRATNDADLATNGMTVLPGGLVFAAGKTDVGYLLESSNLAPVAAIAGVCGGDPDGGNAYDASTTTLYVPCRSGSIQPVNLTTHTVEPAINGVNGPPTLADGHLWAVSYPGSSLYEIDPATGAKVQTLGTGSPVTTFASPSAADGLVLIGTTNGVTAFAGPGGPPPAGTDPVAAYYALLGGNSSYLGDPIDGVHPVAGGEGEDFAGGAIYW
ncbi:MAG: PQQ-like beta-propeller repeat protein, partial [Actinomycetota bacterium]|nr:PQQ-like beta-propeller repeat protein [Actinomycetota bacterium]